jgi:hypothetical protein
VRSVRFSTGAPHPQLPSCPSQRIPVTTTTRQAQPARVPPRGLSRPRATEPEPDVASPLQGPHRRWPQRIPALFPGTASSSTASDARLLTHKHASHHTTLAYRWGPLLPSPVIISPRPPPCARVARQHAQLAPMAAAASAPASR